MRFRKMETRQPLIQSPNGGPQLSNEEIARYSRHLIMPEVALDGQKKLKSSRVLTIGAGDRKSTRLNSSHANISYAVFCLKKKKTIEQLTTALVLNLAH